jgi:hypothetical protein
MTIVIKAKSDLDGPSSWSVFRISLNPFLLEMTTFVAAVAYSVGVKTPRIF